MQCGRFHFYLMCHTPVKAQLLTSQTTKDITVRSEITLTTSVTYQRRHDQPTYNKSFWAAFHHCFLTSCISTISSFQIQRPGSCIITNTTINAYITCFSCILYLVGKKTKTLWRNPQLVWHLTCSTYIPLNPNTGLNSRTSLVCPWPCALKVPLPQVKTY